MSDENESIHEFISHDELSLYWHDKSTPKKQFEDQIVEEMGLIWDANPETDERTDKSFHVNHTIQGGWLYDQAFEEVKAQWIEQGIWRDEWEHKNGPGYTDLWKHEESPPSFYTEPLADQRGARFRPKWREALIQQYEASRPINQFIYQVKNEPDRLSDEDFEKFYYSGDINSRAYDTVRARWIERHIWDEDWGTLPGMTWKHEKPVDKVEDSDSETESEAPSQSLSFEEQEGPLSPPYGSTEEEFEQVDTPKFPKRSALAGLNDTARKIQRVY